VAEHETALGSRSALGWDGEVTEAGVLLRPNQHKEQLTMNVKMTVRYVSGREERFEVEIFGGGGAGFRLNEFAKNCTLVLKTEAEVIIIPSHAIEYVSIALPVSGCEQLPLKDLRNAKRLK
jgi:hypothetical protein